MSASTAPTAATADSGRLPPSVVRIADRLDPEQRAAALLPDGPCQVIAPAGSGKTTTLIARIAVLIGRGVPPAAICVVTFNREAALDLAERLRVRVAVELPEARAVEVRTIHALARQVLADGGRRLQIVADRAPLLRAARRRASVGRPTDAPPLPDVPELDTALSAWKIEGRAPDGDMLAVLERYAALLAQRDAVDFDDLVVGAVDRLEHDPAIRAGWQSRFRHVLVDEFQDVDAAQLRLARLLAEPERNLYVVGDDDQTIYAWRLADVRRILRFREDYPEAPLVMLATNYRCPSQVVRASRRLIGHNAERFVKRIEPAAAADEATPSIGAFAAVGPDWPDALASALAGDTAHPGRTAAVLARTRSELVPITSALLRLGIRHWTTEPTPLEVAPVAALLDDLGRLDSLGHPFPELVRLRAGRGWARGSSDALSDDDQQAIDAVLGWATGFRSAAAFLSAARAALERLRALRDPEAPLELLTVHGAKGREWETVAVIGMEEDRFPNRRALLGAPEPLRAIEEERRLAYVAVTRPTRRLILVFDPARPSRFVTELGLAAAPAAGATAPAAGVAADPYRPTSGAIGVR